MVESYKPEHLRSIDVTKMQPYELLLALGALMAVLLGLLFFAVGWAAGIPANAMAGALTTLVVDIVLGGTLWIGARVAARNHMNGAIVSAACATILVIFGGQPGVIGGLLGLVGTLLAVASPYMPWAKRA